METRMNDERAFNAAMDCVDLCEYYTKHPTNAKYIDGFLAAGFYDEDHIFADATLDCLKTNLNIAAATDGDNIFTARQVSAKQIRSMRFAVNPVEIKIKAASGASTSYIVNITRQAGKLNIQKTKIMASAPITS